MIEIKRSLLRHFGVEEQGMHWDPICEDFKNDIVDAIKRNQMLVIIGDKGMGKNILHQAACESLPDNIIHVNVRNYYKEKLDISSIINAAIYDLSNESPKRDLEARSRQFIRIIGAKFVGEKKLISILINEGHRIHSNTYRALKELRETTFNGISPLFSVIITGHPELLAKIESRKEVLWRCQTLQLNEAEGWMQIDQRIKYIKSVFKNAVTNEAAKRIAAICKIPLEINFYIERKMEEARRAGKKVIDGEVIQPSIRELKEAMDFSLKEIADQAGIGKTTVHDVINNPAHPQAPIVRKAIEALQAAKSGKNVSFSKAV